MYIIAIGWMYVVTLMAATENNFAAGLATFFFYGFFPCGVLVYIMGTKSRKLKRKIREEAEQALPVALPADLDAQHADKKTTENQ